MLDIIIQPLPTRLGLFQAYGNANGWVGTEKEEDMAL